MTINVKIAIQSNPPDRVAKVTATDLAVDDNNTSIDLGTIGAGDTLDAHITDTRIITITEIEAPAADATTGSEPIQEETGGAE